MATVKLSEKNIPLYGEYDVVVVGGGTAGAIAAISAGQENLKTLVIEQFGSLGGSQTNALVNPIMPSFIKGNPITSSICDNIHKRMVELGCAVNDEGPRDRFFDPNGFFNGTQLKVVLETMALEVGCDILYHTRLADVIKEDNKIKYIIIHNKNGFSAVEAKTFIDCTGDADLAYISGVQCNSGDANGVNSSMTLRFEMANVDMEKLSEYLIAGGQTEFMHYPTLHVDDFGWCPEFRKFVLEKHHQGELTHLDICHLQFFSIPGKPNNLSFNCPELGNGKNLIDADNLSKKQIEGKIAIRRIYDFMKKYIPGFENAYISEIAPMLGLRESRRIEAEYVFSEKDVFNYRKFEDGIASNNFFIDVHGEDNSNRDKGYVDLPEEQKYYEVPYRSLVPKGIDNLLVAGRCAGLTFYGEATVRVQRTCRAMGEAAGIAAALSIRENIPFREVDGKLVKDMMCMRGAQL